MATTDSELIEEVRAFTGYTTSDISDQNMQSLVDIAKRELESDFGTSDFNFYGENLDIERALFWFTCIGTKVRTGEIGSIDFTLDDIESSTPPDAYQFWFSQFEKRRSLATTQLTGVSAASRSIERDNRTYEFQRPQG
jgi:hypothetical protein